MHTEVHGGQKRAYDHLELVLGLVMSYLVSVLVILEEWLHALNCCTLSLVLINWTGILACGHPKRYGLAQGWARIPVGSFLLFIVLWMQASSQPLK